jgi:O-antigen/teichoic acid export membrane protein
MGLLGLGVAGASVVVGTVGAVWVLATAPPEFRPSLRAFSVPAARLLATSGAAFTAISVAALLISYTDVIIISQVLGPASVPAYAVPYSLLTVFISLILVALDAMWPAFGEAASIGDGTWLRAAHRRVVFGCLAASIVFAIAIATAGPFVIRIWAGDAVVPPAGLLLVLGAIAVIQGFELPYGRILIATGRVRGYALAGLLNAAINLPLSIILARPLGIVGVALGTLIGYVLLAPPLIVWARRALRDVEGERT